MVSFFLPEVLLMGINYLSFQIRIFLYNYAIGKRLQKSWPPCKSHYRRLTWEEEKTTFSAGPLSEGKCCPTHALMRANLNNAQISLQKQTSVMSAKAFSIFMNVETFSPFVYASW